MPQAVGDANHFLAKTQRKIELSNWGRTLILQPALASDNQCGWMKQLLTCGDLAL